MSGGRVMSGGAGVNRLAPGRLMPRGLGGVSRSRSRQGSSCVRASQGGRSAAGRGFSSVGVELCGQPAARCLIGRSTPRVPPAWLSPGRGRGRPAVFPVGWLVAVRRPVGCRRLPCGADPRTSRSAHCEWGATTGRWCPCGGDRVALIHPSRGRRLRYRATAFGGAAGEGSHRSPPRKHRGPDGDRVPVRSGDGGCERLDGWARDELSQAFRKSYCRVSRRPVTMPSRRAPTPTRPGQ